MPQPDHQKICQFVDTILVFGGRTDGHAIAILHSACILMCDNKGTHKHSGQQYARVLGYGVWLTHKNLSIL